jgi:hypothetical protein
LEIIRRKSWKEFYYEEGREVVKQFGILEKQRESKIQAMRAGSNFIA